MDTIKVVFDFISSNSSNTVVLVMMVLAILTAVKQGLAKMEEVSSPGWLNKAVKILKKISEFITANDGQTD